MLRREYLLWWAVLGGIVGAANLVSFMQYVFAFGLSPIPAKMLEYYRGLIAPLQHFIVWIVPLSMPKWYADLWILSFFIMSNEQRAVLATTDNKDFSSRAADAALSVLTIFILSPLLIPAALAVARRALEFFQTRRRLPALQSALESALASRHPMDYHWWERAPAQRAVRDAQENLEPVIILHSQSRVFWVSMVSSLAAAMLFYVWNFSA